LNRSCTLIDSWMYPMMTDLDFQYLYQSRQGSSMVYHFEHNWTLSVWFFLLADL
jgi:hypothetical protein